MDSKSDSSSQLITRRDSMNLDDTLQDADEEILENIVPTKSKTGRKMGLEYAKVVTLSDYASAKVFIAENMSTYK